MVSERVDHATAVTKALYSRIAPIYDLVETLPELRYRSWRRRFWGEVNALLDDGYRILEVGVGTGKNIPFWPPGLAITAIDLTPDMVDRARKKALMERRSADFREGDVQGLEFPDNSFDVAVATFVFCSVPDPVLGLVELSRVVKTGGHILLLEHVRSTNQILGRLMDWLNPLVRKTLGPNINRDTVSNVLKAELQLLDVVDLDRGGIFKIIRAQNSSRPRGSKA